jgi:hypothetical protein
MATRRHRTLRPRRKLSTILVTSLKRAILEVEVGVSESETKRHRHMDIWLDPASENAGACHSNDLGTSDHWWSLGNGTSERSAQIS